MRLLVSDLLDYARLGSDAIVFEPVELDSVLSDVHESVREFCESSGAQIRISKLPTIVGDERQ